MLLRAAPSGSWQELALPELSDAGMMLLAAALCPVLLGCIRSAGSVSARFWGTVVMAAVFTAFGFLREPFLWIALLAGCWIFWILSSRYGLLVSLLALLAGGAVLPVLPDKVLSAVTGIFGFTETTFSDLHRGLLHSAGLLSRSLPWGTGLAAEAAEPVTGLYFEVGIRFGIVGMVVFYLLLFSFFLAVVRFARTTTRREIHPLVLGAFCGVLTLLTAGFFLPVTSLSVVALLFLLASFPKIATLACRREEIRLPY